SRSSRITCMPTAPFTISTRHSASTSSEPIMDNAYDLVVIGAGPAGQSAAELAAFLGRSVLIVERARPGGTVTTTGGVPTKTLREVALSLAAGTPNRGRNAESATAFADALPAVRAATIGVCETLQGV